MKACGSALALGAAVGLLAAGGGGTSQAAELWIMTGMGPSTGVYEVAAGYEKATKNKVTVTFETGPSLDQKLQSDAPADIIAAGPEQLEAHARDFLDEARIVQEPPAAEHQQVAMLAGGDRQLVLVLAAEDRRHELISSVARAEPVQVVEVCGAQRELHLERIILKAGRA